MPSKSLAQHKLMVAVAHNPKFAKKVGIPQSVGKEFERHDKKKMHLTGSGLFTDPEIKQGFKKL